MYRENTDSGYIPPGKQVQMTKTAIRKRLHFTDERHDLAAAIRKYGVFADGPALPVRNTGFWARNGVSRHGKASISAKPARDTDFWTENGVSRHGKASVSQNLLAIQTFGRKRVCRGMGKQLNRRKPVHDWSMGPDESWRTVKISRL